MKIQELIQATELDMTELQIRAFFLGVLSAERPLPFSKALEELLSQTPEAKPALEAPLKTLWEELSKDLPTALAALFPEQNNLQSFMEMAKDQLDYFLTALSLSGTNTENCKNAQFAELIDELEDTVEDLDDYLTEEGDPEDGEDFKEFLLGTWNDLVELKRSN
jgi:hypothetical protein